MNQVSRYAHAPSFEKMGPVILIDLKEGIKVHAGEIYEGKTVKGHTNLIVTMRSTDGFILYCHGDKIRKVKNETFMMAVLHGDLQPRKAKEIDTQRLAMATIGLDAVANRRTAEEQIEYYGDGAAERYYGSNGSGGPKPLVRMG